MELSPPYFARNFHRQRSVSPAVLVLGFLVVLSFSTPTGRAQGPSTQLYEGLTVSTVELVAQPSINVEALRPLVAQQAGAPYSSAAIQKSVEALQATGKFTKVEVEAKPETRGLRVTFILEPAFYVGMIYFPGATNAFRYQRLLQVANYPAQEPYQAARARRGEACSRDFSPKKGTLPPPSTWRRNWMSLTGWRT